MVHYTDFAKAFQNGYRFPYTNYDGVIEDVTFSVQPVGKLVLTSGKLLACDPGFAHFEERCFTKRLKPGRYPVILSLLPLVMQDGRMSGCLELKQMLLPLHPVTEMVAVSATGDTMRRTKLPV